MKTYTSGLAERTGLRYKDIWFDDLLSQAKNGYKVEGINSPAFLKRRSSAAIRSDVSSTLLELLASALARLGWPRRYRKMAGDMSACIQRGLASRACTPERVHLEILRFYWLKRFYGWLLDRVCPRWVLTADPGEYALVAAAKERGIKVGELQHGIVDKCHYAYAWPREVAEFRRSLALPDRLFLYGDYWKKALGGDEFWGDSLRVVGSSRVDAYRALRAARVGERGRAGLTVVTTTQGIQVSQLILFLKQFLELVPSGQELKLILKLHPVYETSKAAYESAFGADGRVEVVLGSEDPSTFELLARADLHLSVSSTCHFEAVGLGVPTVILPLENS